MFQDVSDGVESIVFDHFGYPSCVLFAATADDHLATILSHSWCPTIPCVYRSTLSLLASATLNLITSQGGL